MAPESPSGALNCLGTLAVFVVVVSPLYLLLRVFVRLIRDYYGFDPPVPDEGPPLRICAGCHNTVLEQDFTHCPYCGRDLPPAAAPKAVGDDPEGSVSPPVEPIG